MNMRLVLMVTALVVTRAAEESCVGRCAAGFDSGLKCQCDLMCRYYSSCCSDYETVCLHKQRGDTFEIPHSEIKNASEPTTTATSVSPTASTSAQPDPDADACSGRSFDAFMQLKNGSTYAFRGDYFFEMDERAVLPGYPKLIKDVWGITGPIDAAFTRINCQGKTYIFKGNKYWRFEDDVLDEDYPRDISVGFEKIPDDVDAAFAIPAPGHHRKEKVYFFKGDQYYQYEFQNQPSHEECAKISKASPSVLFNHFAERYCQQWEDLITTLFQGFQGHHHGPRFISRDWVGIKPPVDAVLAGRLYLSPAPSPSPSPAAALRGRKDRKRSSRRRQRKQQRRRGQKKQMWSYDSDFDYDYRMDFPHLYEYEEQDQNLPVQNIYFFKKDQYSRVDLQTKRVDFAEPPYPRSIAKYWLGCKEKPGAEKK